MEWFVLYTKPKWEKKVAEGLQKVGIECFCPTVTEIRQWSDRKKKVRVPLFRSFVFVKLEEKQRELVFEIPGVVRYLFWMQKPAVVREEEIQTIKDWLDNDSVVEIETDRLHPGEEIVINKGSFKGKKAVVSELGKKRLRLILPSMNCVVSVKINEVL